MDTMRRTGYLGLVLLGGIAVLILYLAAGHTVIADVYYQRSLPALNGVIGHASEHPLQFYLKKADDQLLYAATVWLSATMAYWLARRRLRRAGRDQPDLFDRIVFLFCTGAFYVFLVRFGSEREWNPVAQVMNFTADPPFQHRVMFVVPAQALRALFPSISYFDSFLWSQMLAAVLALWAVKRLASLFIRQDLAFIAQPLLLAIWAPTLRYYTFYDIGIVFVFAFCLYHLYRKQFRPYLLMLALGTFNHETTLFLIVASAFVLYGNMDVRRLAGLLLLQLAIYGLVRALLFYLLPTHAAWQGGKFPYNIFLLTERPLELLGFLGPLLLWYCGAATGWRSAPPALRRSMVVLPCLVVMTILVGQLHEARQFDAFIPLVIALLVSRVAEKTGAYPDSSRITSRLAACQRDDAAAFDPAPDGEQVQA